MEIVSSLVTFASGGAAGAFVTEWFRRRRGRVERIPLIERVNRLVNPGLEGITLARRSTTNAQLEEVTNVREYQLTMRNTSSNHLKNAEVQFEFPTEDVTGIALRPTLSKTTLVSLDPVATPLGRKAFRWRIPHFPSGDSVEFTFRAVSPSSDGYEAAIYQSEGIVLERIIGEPPPKKGWKGPVVGSLMVALVVAVIVALISTAGDEKVSTIKLGGCELRVVSLFDLYGQRLSSPWRVKHRILDVGAQDCVIQSEKMKLVSPVTVKSGVVIEREDISEKTPKLVDVEISVGTTSTSLAKTTVPIYVQP
jgi:hypothetical protein